MSSDLVDDELRDALERLAAALTLPESASPVEAMRSRARTRRLQRRSAVAAVLTLIVAGAVLVATVLQSRGGSEERVRVGGSSRPSVVVAPANGAQVLPAAPLAPRRGAAVVWAGDELVVWGGYTNVSVDGRTSRSYTDGASYNPTTRAWRAMASSPVPAAGDDPPIAVTVGEKVVIARGMSVAAWTPATNRWRQLQKAPRPLEDLERVSTDMVVSVSADATLDLRSGRWRDLPVLPTKFTKLEPTQITWTGREIIVVGQQGERTMPVVLAYRPGADHWIELRSPTSLNANAIATTWTGQHVIALDYELHAATYDPEANSWRALPPAPARFFEWLPRLHAVPSSVTAFLGNSIAILSGEERWTVLPYEVVGFQPAAFPSAAPATAPVGNGEPFFIFGLTDQGTNTLALVDPERLVASAREIQVGVATVTLPRDARLGNWTTAVNTARTRVSVDVATSTGACQIGSAEPNGPKNPVPTPWQSDSTGRTWTKELASTDTIDITCDNAATARTLVRNTRVRGP